jgi:hypothetical protein
MFLQGNTYWNVSDYFSTFWGNYLRVDSYTYSCYGRLSVLQFVDGIFFSWRVNSRLSKTNHMSTLIYWNVVPLQSKGSVEIS